MARPDGLVTGFLPVLTPDELNYCAVLADRNSEKSKRAEDKSGVSLPRSKRDPVGVAGENAVWLALHDFPWWTPIDPFYPTDVGDYQVRTRSKDGYGLLIQPRNEDDEIFIHVVRLSPLEYRVGGWLRAGDAKQEEFRMNPGVEDDPTRRECWIVPEDRLNPMGNLPGMALRYL